MRESASLDGPDWKRSGTLRSRSQRRKAEPSRLDQRGSGPSRAATWGALSSLALSLTACSLQDFDSLSNGSGGRTSDAAAGAGGDAPGPSSGGTGGTLGRGGAGSGGNGASSGGSGGSTPARAGSGGSPSRGGAGGTGGASPDSDGSGGSSGDGADPGDAADAGARSNLLSDPGFEAGHVSWVAFGSSAIIDVDGEGRGGSRCIASVNRTQPFEGPARRIDTLVTGGNDYAVEAWVRVSSGSQPVSISLKTVCHGSAESYSQVVSGLADASDWTHLTGEFTAPTCVLDEFRFYLEGPLAGISFYVDDAGLYPSP